MHVYSPQDAQEIGPVLHLTQRTWTTGRTLSTQHTHSTNHNYSRKLSEVLKQIHIMIFRRAKHFNDIHSTFTNLGGSVFVVYIQASQWHYAVVYSWLLKDHFSMINSVVNIRISPYPYDVATSGNCPPISKYQF